MTEALMAKKKQTKPSQSSGSSRRLSVQATDEWIAWVEKGADYCRTDVSKLVDVALAHYLRGEGFEDKPPRRVP